MEPISMALMTGASLGLQIYGMSKTQSASSAYNTAQIQEIHQQQAVEEQRRQVMELDAQRKQLEYVRNAQKARSAGLAGATSKGAQFGSGLQGGYGQIASATAYGEEGISQSLEIGRKVFDLNAQISASKIAMANAQKDMQTAQGFSQLGSSLAGAAGPFGRLAGQFGGQSANPAAMNPWGYSSNPGSYGFSG